MKIPAPEYQAFFKAVRKLEHEAEKSALTGRGDPDAARGQVIALFESAWRDRQNAVVRPDGEGGYGVYVAKPIAEGFYMRSTAEARAARYDAEYQFVPRAGGAHEELRGNSESVVSVPPPELLTVAEDEGTG